MGELTGALKLTGRDCEKLAVFANDKTDKLYKKTNIIYLKSDTFSSTQAQPTLVPYRARAARDATKGTMNEGTELEAASLVDWVVVVPPPLVSR